MSLPKAFRNLFVVFGGLLIALTAAPQQSAAQGFFDSIFGGQSGGSKQVVNFSRSYRSGTIVVSFADRRLYHVVKRGKAVSYPVAVPKGNARWSGQSFVSRKKVNPPWTPTAKMRRENPKLPAHVPGGHPRNPLGKRALYLGSTLYRIHGTDAPWTIGQAVSHGCIRMHNNHVAELYKRVRVGTKVIVTWKKFRTSI